MVKQETDVFPVAAEWFTMTTAIQEIGGSVWAHSVSSVDPWARTSMPQSSACVSNVTVHVSLWIIITLASQALLVTNKWKKLKIVSKQKLRSQLVKMGSDSLLCK